MQNSASTFDNLCFLVDTIQYLLLRIQYTFLATELISDFVFHKVYDWHHQRHAISAQLSVNVFATRCVFLLILFSKQFLVRMYHVSLYKVNISILFQYTFLASEFKRDFVFHGTAHAFVHPLQNSSSKWSPQQGKPSYVLYLCTYLYSISAVTLDILWALPRNK